jgi:arginase
MKSPVCIGVPYWLGERQNPSAVDAMKTSGIAEELGAAWVDASPDFGAHADPVVAVNRAVGAAIRAHPDHLPLIFAGECVTALGALKGLEPLNPAVLWYDAHGDFNTPETSPSGFLGGMPLAALVGRGNADLMAGIELAPLAESDVIITDARDLDPEEGDNLRSSALTHLPDANALLTVPLPETPLYIHFDTDIVDSDEMPAMNYPVPGGPTNAQVAATLTRVARDGQVVGVLFSLWNQGKPGADRALRNTLDLVRALMTG